MAHEMRSILRKIPPYDIVAAGWIIVACVLLDRLPIRYPVLLTLQQALQSFWPFLALSLLACAIAAYVTRDRKGGWSPFAGTSNLARPAYWFELLQISAVWIVTLVLHFLLKSSLFLINPRNYDHGLAVLDETLFFGISPSRFFVALFDNPVVYRFFDLYYSFIYFVIFLVYTSVILGIARDQMRRTFATAFTMLWVLGFAAYVGVPSWGPVFIHPEDFESALDHMPGTVHVQTQLYNETAALIRDPKAPRIVRYGGIAAFPSLHVAVLTLFSIATMQISRRWGYWTWLLTLIMLLGSVVTGYHYLIDGYAGIAIGLLVFWVSKRWVSALSTETERAQDPTPATTAASPQ